MHLNCHSYHSLHYGTISVEDLVQEAVQCGLPALALTDINTVSGIYDFVKACREVSIKPLVGVEIRENNRLLYITLAKKQSGIGEICRLLTSHFCDGEPLPQRAPNFQEVICIYPMETLTLNDSGEAEGLGSECYIGVRPHQLTQLYKKEWQKLLHRMVLLCPVTLRNQKEYQLHRILRAMDRNTLLSKLSEEDTCRPDERMKPVEELWECYKDYPQLIANTMQVIESCHFEFEFHRPRNKKHYTENAETDRQLLSSLARKGLKIRYGKDHPAQVKKARQRMERELKVIDELGFSAYFLITWDIVRYSQQQGFLHVGRGSGANSIIAYCLEITDICPLELDLYFERFLNLNRKVPPDFDIDWSWRERDVILRYVFERYGREHVAFCGTNVEFKHRSIVREIGKVFGLAKEELDALAASKKDRYVPNDRLHDPENPEGLEQSRLVQWVLEYGNMLNGHPHQRSMHACGILISEEPITNYTALEMPSKGFPIVQFDMHVAEDIGLEKFDILSQRGIGHINDAVAWIQRNRGISVNIRDTKLSKDNPVCNEWLARGQTIGCFYIESPAMRGLLRRLRCDNYRTLVAASSIIRPGVAKSGMMKEYIFRHNHPDQFEYVHPVFQEHLGETYGIMVYQEDVIKIAMHYGGLSAADGDILRRAMSGKGRSLSALQKVRENFFESCRILGHPEDLSREVYRQIESFAGYSFCKAHSASYAVESYQSLYLKAYYPIEFMVAVINNMGGFYRTEVYVHEARRSGATILNPCVNRSEYETCVSGSDVYLGLMHLQGLEEQLGRQIPVERAENGLFRSLDDFIQRIPIGLESLQNLILIGALRFSGKSKNELLVEARLLLVHTLGAGGGRGSRGGRGTGTGLGSGFQYRQPQLLQEPLRSYRLPELRRSRFEDAFDEIELLGFPVSCSPFDLLRTSYRGDVMAAELIHHHRQQIRMLAYLIARKQVPTSRGTMYFGTWIDAQGDYFDTVHFADSLRSFPFRGGGCYLLLGTVEVDNHFPTITIHKMAKMPFIPDPRYAHSAEDQHQAAQKLMEDVSSTHRAPYPSEAGLPRKAVK